MLGLGRLWTALARLAGAIEGLAATAEATNHELRLRLSLDTPEREQLPGGEVIEEPEPANGRRKKGGR